VVNNRFLCGTGRSPNFSFVLLYITEYFSLLQAGGDQVLLSSVISSLLRCLADPGPLTRQMAVEGLSGLVHCSPLEIDTLAEVSSSSFHRQMAVGLVPFFTIRWQSRTSVAWSTARH
jgi:hypothetical protein